MTLLSDWMKAFKLQTACPEVSSSLLWWIPEGSSYTQIGGWKTPYMQFLSQTNLCGETIITNKVIDNEVI